VSTESNDAYLERVKNEIRAQALALAQRPLLERQVPAERIAPSAPIERHRLVYPIGELTDRHYRAFVDQAFRALLKRAPEPAEENAQLRLLAAGAAKPEVLGNLRWSPEGRRVGVRVSGLAPRYALAKLRRIPVLGYLLEWGLSLAGLPLLIRHQRAAEAMFAAAHEEARRTAADAARRLDAHAAAGALLGQRIDDLHAFAHELDKARDAATIALGEIESALRARIEILEGTAQAHAGRLDELAFLRQRVYAINHWSHELELAFARIEDVARCRDAESNALAARAADAVLSADTQRSARNTRWMEELAHRLAPPAAILTLASGSDCADLLRARGYRVCETDGGEAASAAETQENHTFSAAPAILKRSEDASVDGLVVLSTTSLARSMPLPNFIAEAARVLRPDGLILLAFANEPGTLVDTLLGKAMPAISADLLEPVLAAGGFRDVVRVDAVDGTPAVLARTVGA
jgi:SAM-dependent methyltransferase